MATRTSFCSWSTRCESPSLGLSHGVLHEQKLVRVTALLPRSCPCPYKSVTFPDNLPGSRYRFPRSLIREEKTAREFSRITELLSGNRKEITAAVNC